MEIGDEISVEVLSTEEMKNLIFFVHGRSDVLKSDNLEVPNSKSFKFSFKTMKAMMPKSKLLVYYIRDDGEIISDHLEFNLGFALQNSVSLKFKALCLLYFISISDFIHRSILNYQQNKPSLVKL